MNLQQYFYRTAIFSRQNNQISLADIDYPEKMTPLEEWMGTVLSLADGQHSIKEFISYMSARYPQPPANLQETVSSVIERLQEGKLVQLSDKAVELPYYLSAPIEELDIEKAKLLIKQDGYTQH